jgi:hypothetical protein
LSKLSLGGFDIIALTRPSPVPNLKGRQMAAFSLLSVLFKIAKAPAASRYSTQSAASRRI